MGYAVAEMLDVLPPWMLGLWVPIAFASIEIVVLHLMDRAGL